MASGIEKIPLWFPDDAPPWFRIWLQAFVRDYLAKADIRNAVGVGVDISGSSNDAATISTSEDVTQLFDADFLLAEANALLPNARTIAGEAGVLNVTDSGPGGGLQVSVTVNGVGLDKLSQVPPTSVLANPTGSPGDVQTLYASTDDTALVRQAGALTWAAFPVGANPSASIGLTAVNGSASTFLRSDAAPALSQAILPTWSGVHDFSAGARVTGSASNATGLNLKYSSGVGTVRAHNGSNATLNLESEAGIALDIAGNTTISVLSNRRVSIAAPSSGTTLQLTAVSAGTALSASDGTVTATFNFSGTDLNFGTTGAHDFNLLTNNTARVAIGSGGGMVVGSATGGNQGDGTVNATGLYVNGVAVGSGASGANPTASVGLTTVNGVATTFMRSDAAPALDQGISPTWTGTHTFSDEILGPAGSNTTPAFSFSGDPDTGMYSSGANTLNFATNGASRLQIGAGGAAQFTASVQANAFDLTTGGTTTNGLILQASGDVRINAAGALTLRLEYNGSIHTSTFTGQVVTGPSATSQSSLRLPHGTAPSAPVNGDIWTTTAGLFVRINGSTIGPLS